MIKLDLGEILAEAASSGKRERRLEKWRDRVRHSSETQIERLKDFLPQYDVGVFNVGDIVMARPGFNSRMVGVPGIVVELNEEDRPIFEGAAEAGSAHYGHKPAIRVAYITSSDDIVLFWNERHEYHPWDEELARVWSDLDD